LKKIIFESFFMSIISRCPWSLKTEIEQGYHDCEWGVPQFEDQILFEFIILESMQAGLSWRTILNKRENYRILFDRFDAEAIARYNAIKVETLLGDTRVIRHRKKIQGAIRNAQAYLKICEEKGNFSSYFWGFTEGRSLTNHWHDPKDVPAVTPLAETISKDMKRRGFVFFGPITCYAHMQATGMVNDHLMTCYRHAEISDRMH